MTLYIYHINMTILFEKSYQNGNGKGIGVGGIRCAVKLVKPLINDCLNEKIRNYVDKQKNKSTISKTKKENEKLGSKTLRIKKTGTIKNKSMKQNVKTIKNKVQKNKNKKKKDYLD